jgi:hypothetical protein
MIVSWYKQLLSLHNMLYELSKLQPYWIFSIQIVISLCIWNNTWDKHIILRAFYVLNMKSELHQYNIDWVNMVLGEHMEVLNMKFKLHKILVLINSIRYDITYLKEASRHVRPERVNKWPSSMTDIWWWLHTSIVIIAANFCDPCEFTKS